MLRGSARFVIGASGCRFHVRGVDTLLTSTPSVIVCNHSSYLDSVVLMAALPVEYRFVANDGLVRILFIRAAIRKAGYLTVNRSDFKSRAECVEQMIDTVRHGVSIVVYPEGTTSRTAALLPFRPGAFRVSVETGRPIVPITINGTAAIWPRGRWTMKRGAIDVHIHEPITSGEGNRDEIARVRARARAVIQSVKV